MREILQKLNAYNVRQSGKKITFCLGGSKRCNRVLIRRDYMDRFEVVFSMVKGNAFLNVRYKSHVKPERLVRTIETGVGISLA